MDDYGHWDISRVGEFYCDDFFGFTYEIEEIDTTRIYIGRKIFRHKSKKSSNWREYTSSSEELQALIVQRGKENFNFRITTLCVGKSQLTYEEEHLQMVADVLRTRMPNGERKYFNKSIGYKRFAGVEKQTDQAKQKITAYLKDRPKCASHKEAISVSTKKAWANDPKRKAEFVERNKDPDFIKLRKTNNQFIKNASIDYDGEKLTLCTFIKKHGKVSRGCVDGRLKRGWNVFDAVLTPVEHPEKSHPRKAPKTG